MCKLIKSHKFINTPPAGSRGRDGNRLLRFILGNRASYSSYVRGRTWNGIFSIVSPPEISILRKRNVPGSGASSRVIIREEVSSPGVSKTLKLIYKAERYECVTCSRILN